MTNDAASNRLPKLKGRENYKIWASQIQTYIDGVGSWEIVLGTEDPPDPPNDIIPSDFDDSLHEEEEARPSEASIRQHKRDLRQYKEDLREYKSRAAKAKSAIEVNCIEPI
jgi:hypothetical protein